MANAVGPARPLKASQCSEEVMLEDEAASGPGLVVAHGEAGAGRDGSRGRGEVDVEIVGGEGEGAAFGVGDGEGVVCGASAGESGLPIAGGRLEQWRAPGTTGTVRSRCTVRWGRSGSAGRLRGGFPSERWRRCVEGEWHCKREAGPRRRLRGTRSSFARL